MYIYAYEYIDCIICSVICNYVEWRNLRGYVSSSGFGESWDLYLKWNFFLCINILCRNLYALGKGVWKKWKKRYYILVQVSQYTFAMCSYKEKKSEPTEMLQLDGYTVDYIEAASGKRKFFLPLISFPFVKIPKILLISLFV